MNASFRDVDSKVFQEFKVELVKRGLKSGTALTQALKFWIETKKTAKKKKASIFDVKPWNWKCENDLSERIDEVLYGWKK